MNRVYSVKMSHHKSILTQRYEVVAPSPAHAISKARTHARREFGWYANWVVEELIHRGRAI